MNNHADKWHDIGQGYDGLHAINPVRIEFIKRVIQDCFKDVIKGTTALDLGCGGGILTDPLYNLGFKVTGADKDLEAIKSARIYNPNIDFLHTDSGNIKGKFDYVFALEIIEHVEDQFEFVRQCANLAKKGVFISTLNRNVKSYILGILIAEMLTGMVERGTHQWKKFVKPRELISMCASNRLRLVDIKGMKFLPFKQDWVISNNTSVNYICAFKKR